MMALLQELPQQLITKIRLKMTFIQISQGPKTQINNYEHNKTKHNKTEGSYYVKWNSKSVCHLWKLYTTDSTLLNGVATTDVADEP